jgi:hypothetical protein
MPTPPMAPPPITTAPAPTKGEEDGGLGVVGIYEAPRRPRLGRPTVFIAGWSKPGPVTSAAPGEVIAQEHGPEGGHAGIVVMNLDGTLATASANTAVKPEGVITQNDWGLRRGPLNADGVGPNGEHAGDSAPVVRRYVGEVGLKRNTSGADMKRIVISILLLCALVAIVFGVWALTYPQPDPKSFQYVFWKLGVYPLDRRMATDLMVGDSDRIRLVVGKTREQLEKRFGTLLSFAQAPQYFKKCYLDSPWNGRTVMFIEGSAWMVVFDGDRATELVLVKGC